AGLLQWMSRMKGQREKGVWDVEATVSNRGRGDRGPARGGRPGRQRSGTGDGRAVGPGLAVPGAREEAGGRAVRVRRLLLDTRQLRGRREAALDEGVHRRV